MAPIDDARKLDKPIQYPYNCRRYFYMVILVFFMIASGIKLFIGCWVLSDPAAVLARLWGGSPENYTMNAYFMSTSYVFRFNVYVLIGTNVFCLLLPIVGFIAVLKVSIRFYRLYIMVTTVSSLATIVICFLSSGFNMLVYEDVETMFFNIQNFEFDGLYNSPNVPSKIWFTLQQKYSCCGIEGAEDYQVYAEERASNWYKSGQRTCIAGQCYQDNVPYDPQVTKILETIRNVTVITETSRDVTPIMGTSRNITAIMETIRNVTPIMEVKPTDVKLPACCCKTFANGALLNPLCPYIPANYTSSNNGKSGDLTYYRRGCKGLAFGAVAVMLQEFNVYLLQLFIGVLDCILHVCVLGFVLRKRLMKMPDAPVRRKSIKAPYMADMASRSQRSSPRSSASSSPSTSDEESEPNRVAQRKRASFHNQPEYPPENPHVTFILAEKKAPIYTAETYVNNNEAMVGDASAMDTTEL